MQIVIDVDENLFTRLFDNGMEDYGIGNDDVFAMAKSICNGILLPKGHGRLIDVDDLDIITITTDDYSGNEVLDVVLKEDIDDAPTIIEADKSESEKGQPKQTRDEKMIDAIDFAIKAIDSQDDYSMGMRNGMRYVKSLIDGKDPQYELRQTDEEIKLGIDLGDEVVGDYGAKGVVVGIDTHKDEVVLSLLMGNHKVPQIVKASSYKTKTGRHFPQIIEVLKQIKGEADGK